MVLYTALTFALCLAAVTGLYCQQHNPNAAGSVADTSHRKYPWFFLEGEGGWSVPVGAFGGRSYTINDGGSSLCGFASLGYAFDGEIGMEFHRCWSFIIKGSYYHNKFDATGYLNENIIFLDKYNPSLSSSPFNVQKPVAAVGNYFYTQNSLFTGVSHTLVNKTFNAAFQFLLGQFWAGVPEINGTAYYINPYNGNIPPHGPVKVIFPAQNSGRNFGLDIGMQLGVKIWSSFHLLCTIDYVFGQAPTSQDSGNAFTSNVCLFIINSGVSYEF